MRRRTLIYWDVDGVLSIRTNENEGTYIHMAKGLPVWPSPTGLPLVRAIDADRRFRNIWLSSWGTHAILWNQRAGTKAWPVANHMTPRQWLYAKRVLPTWVFREKPRVDKKLIAVQYDLWRRRYPEAGRVLWVEDGFAEETQEWAARRGNVQLIHTREEPMLSALLNDAVPPDAAAQAFIDRFLVKGSMCDGK